MDQTERLLNLLGLLLESRKPVTFEDIRSGLADAYTQGDHDSAKRMFERDKDALRDLGVPVETTSKDEWADEHNAYFIPKDKYYLPEIRFTPEEAAALYVAATTAGESDDAERGLRKLLFGTDTTLLSGREDPLLAVGQDFSGPRLAVLADALAERRSISFSYRNVSGESSERRVDPYSLVWRSGHYYLVGLDLDREDIRCFRLSRLASDVTLEGEASSIPEGFSGREHVPGGPWGSSESELMDVHIAFTQRVSWWATAGMRGVRPLASTSGWDEAIVQGNLEDRFVSWVLSFGPDAKVLGPESLQDAIRHRLEETIANL